MTLSLKLLNEIADYNIVLIICDSKAMPQAQLLPLMGNYNTLKIFEQQLN